MSKRSLMKTIFNKGRKFKGLSNTQAKSVAKIAKQSIQTVCEKKHFGFYDEDQELFHNKVDYLDKWLECKQGVADPDDTTSGVRNVRLGDEIYLHNINIRFWLSNKNDRPNCMYKLFLFWYDSGTTLSDAVCFFTQKNKMLDRYNSESISVIDSKTIFSGASYSGNNDLLREHSYLCTLNGKWKNGRKITYDEGGTVPKKRNIGTMVVAYDAFGTLQSDNIASYAYNGLVTITDP
ncbi:MAG: putative capsid protein [Circoviridae sp.]|nr:MAG: putative capsid protein [Circoviridae sp.]